MNLSIGPCAAHYINIFIILEKHAHGDSKSVYPVTNIYSLYSTATQNHSHRVLAMAPNATISHYLYQHVSI